MLQPINSRRSPGSQVLVRQGPAPLATLATLALLRDLAAGHSVILGGAARLPAALAKPLATAVPWQRAMQQLEPLPALRLARRLPAGVPIHLEFKGLGDKLLTLPDDVTAAHLAGNPWAESAWDLDAWTPGRWGRTLCLHAVRRIDLSGCNLGEANIGLCRFPVATHVDLSHNGLTAAQVRFFYLPRGEWLSLRNNLLGDAGCQALRLPAARHVDLRNNEVTRAGLAKLRVAAGCRVDVTGNFLLDPELSRLRRQTKHTWICRWSYAPNTPAGVMTKLTSWLSSWWAPPAAGGLE